MRKLFLAITISFSGFAAMAQDYKESPVLITSREIIEKGVKAYDEEKYEDAIAIFKQVPENDTAYGLALYEHALCYRAMKKPLESIKLLKKGITLRSIYKRSFYEMLGSAYDEAGDFQNSLKTYREGLKEFPTYDMFYNEIGIAYSTHKDGDSAMSNLIRAVEMNPLRAVNHLKLSAFMVANGQLVPALMSFLVYSSLETNTSRSFSQLAAYEKILKKEQSIESDTALKLNYNAEQFAEVEMIIKSNMAVAKDYKVPTKLNYPHLIKNFHVLMEKIEVNKANNDIWNNFYIENLKKIYNEKKFEVFILNIFSTVDLPDIQKEVKKNKKDIEEFQTWLIQLFYNKYMSDRTSMVHGKLITADHGYYGNGNIKSICMLDPTKKMLSGQAYYFYKNGIISAEGVNDNTGKKTGEWIYYSADGYRTSSETYKAGVLDGLYILYHTTGNMREKGYYVDGKVEGEVQYFYSNGSLRKVIIYKNEKATGIEKQYHDNDMLSQVVPFGEGNLYDGEVKKYYSNGNLNYIANFKKGTFDGPYKSYYEKSKALKQEGAYASDKRVGKLTDYYESGKIMKVEDSYVAGKLTGPYITYYENGNIHEKGVYENDQLEGEYIINDSTGRLYAKYVYAKNNLKKVFFYGMDNKQIDLITASNKKYDFKKYYDNGALYEEGVIADDKREGLWKQYYKNGNLRQEMNYKANNYNGTFKTYYRHGQLQTEVNYTEDQRDGLYKEYYPTGKLKQQGWYVKGVSSQNFYNYNETGTIKSDVYLFSGDREGPLKMFDVAGKLNSIQYYENGTLYKVESYDTLGNLLNSSENVHGTGKLSWYHHNGKLNTEVEYKNGYETGTKKVLHDNGALYFETSANNGLTYGPYKVFNTYKKPVYEAFYKQDMLDSLYTQYDFDGYKTSVMHYKFGDLNGLREWYYPNGKVEVSGIYKDDERNGSFNYYAPDGTLMIQRNYIDGVMVSYSYKNASGQMVPLISVSNKKQDLVAYYPNGKKSMEFSYVFGSIHGEYKSWFPNGNKKEEFNRFYDDNEGSQKEYYENGSLMSDEFYKDDNRSGECKYYYETGKLKRVTNYVNGIRHGKETLYDKEGKKTSELIFYNGELAK